MNSAQSSSKGNSVDIDCGEIHESIDLAGQSSYRERPYDVFEQLRDRGGICQVDYAGIPVWLVTDHACIKEAAKNRTLSCDPQRANDITRKARWVFADETYTVTRNMIRADDPEHARLRSIVASEFTHSRVAELRPRVREIVDELINEILPYGEVDIISGFAKRLPLTVISDVLGIPSEGRAEFAELASVYVEMGEGDQGRLPEAASTMRDYITDVVGSAKSDSDGSESLLSRLGNADLDDNEIVAMVFLLLVAGFETTTNLIGNGLLSLLTNPDQLALLRRAPELIGDTIDEILRYEGPIKVAPVLRFTTCNTHIGNVAIPGGGEPVLLAYGAGNRDGKRFSDPEIFDINRRDTRHHLGFGYGTHHCLGSALGKTEAEIALSSLVTRCEELALAVAPDELCWGHSRFMRGLVSLPVTFRARST